jgi:hypothetical protein
MNRKRIAECNRPELKNYEYYRGVSQGMPISPLLASLLLAPNLVTPNVGMLLYADDGILFSTENRVILPVIPASTGISYNLSKSHPIKENSKWLRPLKFLGITYQPATSSTPISERIHSGTLTTSTRTPKDFTLNKLDAFIKAGYSITYNGQWNETFDHWLETKIAGFLQSRLYAGRYDAENILQDFAYTYETNSWSDLEEKRRSKTATYRLNGETFTEDITIFNSSSLANLSLSRWIKNRCPSIRSWKR